MARYHFQGRSRDTYGNVKQNLPITIYEANTSVPAIIYTAFTGGTSTSAAPQISSDNYGYFDFYVDDADYSNNQYFDITSSEFTYTYIDVIRQGPAGTSGSSGTSGTDGTDGSSGSSGTDGTDGSSGTSGSLVRVVLMVQVEVLERQELMVQAGHPVKRVQ